MSYKIFFILPLLLLSCSVSDKQIQNNNTPDDIYWYQKDFTKEGVYGISLEKWYRENFKKTKEQIIVATLDTQIDLNHEDLQGQFWVNVNEIPDNGIDDDKNGYIDDYNGWNFLGTKGGNHTPKNNYEYVKIIRENKKLYDANLLSPFEKKEYEKALEYFTSYENYYTTYLNSLKYGKKIFNLAKDSLFYYYPKNQFKYKELDSIYLLIKKNDTRTFNDIKNTNATDFVALVLALKSFYQLNHFTYEQIDELEKSFDSIVNTNINIHLQERKYIGDDVNILNHNYGNPYVNIYDRQLNHNTEVSGIIAANRKNNIGIKGFSNNIKIMPICIANNGSEHDKDIANGIYYAVDNGAKIINMSFGKEFSIHKKWVFEALQYAASKGVLLIHCAGNDAMNIDVNSFYPSDFDYSKEEDIIDNFINVGSINKKTDSTFVSFYSNYGKKNVDLFAPGEEIYVCRKHNTYETDSGTSLAAPMVSGTAALIWLYHPNLTAQEIKEIILTSGITINKKVIKPGTENEMVSFSELCTSGKVLNTYNAMKMAAEISLKKGI
ncbi:S8 family serine peptidase [Flavobacterium sp. J27]|uniref:S8 family serine peptidase n=1 Tax=Flavobacterium sp. J27 TaxID=2060419 RepID=UPI001031EC6E|nr:S8 family serine peptidase [Flavobacterium sp. J27]